MIDPWPKDTTWDGSLVRPVKIDVAEATHDDLRDRMGRTRWPDTIRGEPWVIGTDPTYLRSGLRQSRRDQCLVQGRGLSGSPQDRLEVCDVPQICRRGAIGHPCTCTLSSVRGCQNKRPLRPDVVSMSAYSGYRSIRQFALGTSVEQEDPRVVVGRLTGIALAFDRSRLCRGRSSPETHRN